MIQKILLIEDEVSVAAVIKKGLFEEGYAVVVTHDGESGLSMLDENDIDLVILDIILPKITGLEVCTQIRAGEKKGVPILMLTALSTTENVVNGLDKGADDYLAKPFKFNELLARIRALSRRKELYIENQELVSIADLTLNLDSKTVLRGNLEITLTSTEYKLLEFFLRNQNKVLSRVDLLESVWNINFDMGTNVVDVYVNYLRNKIDKSFAKKLIHTVIGRGYIMKEES